MASCKNDFLCTLLRDNFGQQNNPHPSPLKGKYCLLVSYSQLSLRQTPLGPTPSVGLKEMSGVRLIELSNKRDSTVVILFSLQLWTSGDGENEDTEDKE